MGPDEVEFGQPLELQSQHLHMRSLEFETLSTAADFGF